MTCDKGHPVGEGTWTTFAIRGAGPVGAPPEEAQGARAHLTPRAKTTFHHLPAASNLVAAPGPLGRSRVVSGPTETTPTPTAAEELDDGPGVTCVVFSDGCRAAFGAVLGQLVLDGSVGDRPGHGHADALKCTGSWAPCCTDFTEMTKQHVSPAISSAAGRRGLSTLPGGRDGRPRAVRAGLSPGRPGGAGVGLRRACPAPCF